MKLTPNQELAVNLRKMNILVSAAAGSGKTSVLVKRIMSQITDKDAPIDIDRMLIMTFTKAAAQEMRERILHAINEELKTDPANVRLQQQALLVHNAQISTIDGFCQSILKDHFREIDLDPNFRVADTNECKLIKMDALGEVLEEAYSKGDDAFFDALEAISTGKSDKEFEELILKLHEFACSNPDPERYLTDSIRPYECESVDEFEQLDFVAEFVRNAKYKLKTIVISIDRALEIIDEMPDLAPYAPFFESEREMIAGAYAKESYDEVRDAVRSISFDTIKAVRTKDEAVIEAKNKVSAVRKTYKDAIASLSRDFAETLADAFEHMKAERAQIKAIISTAIEFGRRFEQKKRDKNIIDFSDMEHYALRILKENPHISAQYREHFEEIYVDEYQDSNLTQEELVQCICRGNNVFMVGDVKQSIYRFRQARPDLFLGKYQSFSEECGPDRKIILNENFRSRIEVVESVNEVFELIMNGEVGNIVYDDAAALHFMANYPPYPKECADDVQGSPYRTEIILIPDTKEVASIELEANVIAVRIKELMRTMFVWDKNKEEYRRLQYGDIAILLKTMKGNDGIVRKVLSEHGIPVEVNTRSGYFSAVEVQTVLAFLSVVDNRLQDVPLATVMRSQIGGFTDDEIATIRSLSPKGRLYDALTAYVNLGTVSVDQVSDKIESKVTKLLDMLDFYRSEAQYRSVYEILRMLIDSEYGLHLMASDNGRQRMANLNMLLEKAEEYGRTSYKGLFHFIRYIELIRKYEIDYGEAALIGDRENAVHIMTIHGSKGLEFPVCILANINKMRNSREESQNVLMSAIDGIGIEYVDPIRRVKCPTLLKKYIRDRLHEENMAEDMRVLYVAMTRAREKLIMTGTAADVDKAFYDRDKALAACSSYMDMLAYANNESLGLITADIKSLGAEEAITKMIESGVRDDIARDELRKIMDCADAEVQVEAAHSDQLDIVTSSNRVEESGIDAATTEKVNASVSVELSEEISRRLGFRYPYTYLRDIPMKLSVSELKKQAMAAQTESGDWAELGTDMYPEIQDSSEVGELTDLDGLIYIPDFMRTEEEAPSGGSYYGTAFHRILELWDYCAGSNKLEESNVEGSNKSESEVTESDVSDFVSRMLGEHRIEEMQAQAVKPADICAFLNSNLGRRMKKAAIAGTLRREQPFVIAVPYESSKADQTPSAADNSASSADYVATTPVEYMLVQGIIDAYFEEDSQYVIVDYKTDRVRKAQELIDRYHVQLDYYQQALEQITGKHVAAKIIYSARLLEEICI